MARLTEEIETPFSIGVCSFNLPFMSDALKTEIETRLRGLPMEYRREALRFGDGHTRTSVVWTLAGEEHPTYSKSAFTVVPR